MSDIYTKYPTIKSRVCMHHPDDLISGKNVANMFSEIPTMFYEFANHPDMVVIYAGPRIGNTSGTTIMSADSSILGKLISQKITPTTQLCFENLHEGNCGPVVNQIYDIIKNTNIKPSQCNYFSAGLTSHELHDRYCERKNITDKINIYSANAWEKNLLVNSQLRQITYCVMEKEKTFLCFNRIFRSHRIAMLGLMYSKNLVDKSFYSFFPDSSYNPIPAPEADLFLQIKNAVAPDVYETAIAGYTANRDKLPLKLNIDWRENINYVRVQDMQLFQQSYFSLVTETFFFGVTHYGLERDEDSVFLTEKTFKPILMKHPFILAARPHTLKYLRKMGYRSFAPFIDESYDDMANDSDRLIAIANEVARLDLFSTEEWIDWQHNIKDIVDHNHSVMVNRKHYQYAFKRPLHETQY